jgi:HAD superfamily hydrolase (TIGR01484 family)
MNAFGEIRAAALDVDGTLLQPSIHADRRDMVPTPRLEGAMARLRNAEIPTIAVTSRNEELLQTEPVKRLRFSALSVIDGGATLYNPRTDTVEDRNWLDTTTRRAVVRSIGEFCTQLYCDTEGTVRSGDDLRLDDIRGEAPSVFAIFNAQHRAAIEDRLGDFDLAAVFNAMDGSVTESCIQITQQAARKENALQTVCDALGIRLEDVLAIGDGPGDVRFIGAAGLRVAMGNSDLSLFAIPGRIIVPSTENDGAAIAIERLAFGEPGELRRFRPATWRDGQRPPMSTQGRDTVLDSVLRGQPLVQDAALFNRYVDDLYTINAVDPWQSVQRLIATLTPSARELYSADLDLLRPCGGQAHAEAVRNLFEEHYVQYLAHSPMALATMRLYLDLQDVGKPLSVAITGDNFSQSKYNPLVAHSIIGALQGEHADTIRLAIELLSAHDIGGELLKAKAADFAATLQRLKDGPLAELRAAWPEVLGVPVDDMALIAYLCDAGAHTRYAAQIDELADGFDLKWAVTKDDQQLTSIFEQDSGGLLLLIPEARGKMAQLLTATTTDLLESHDDEDRSMESHAAELKGTTQDLFHRYRMRNSMAIQTDVDGESFVTVPIPPTLKHERIWAERLIFHEAPKEPPAKPPTIPKPYIVVEGRQSDSLFQEIYYARGGKIWRYTSTQRVSSGGDARERILLLQQLHDRDETYRYMGANAAAQLDVRRTFGQQLSDEEAEIFMGWLQGAV